MTEKMQVVVLMGGLGTRIRGVSPGTPKSMIEVCDRPFFSYQLELMKWHGFRRFVFCIGHGGERIRDFFGDGRSFGVEIKYSSDANSLLGTGGALRKAVDLLDEDILVMYGDGYLDADYSEFIYRYYQARSKKSRKVMMAIYRNRDQYDKSNILFENEELLVYDKTHPLPRMEYIDFGAAIVDRSVVEEIPEGNVDLADVYHRLAAEGMMSGYVVENRFYEIGTPESLDEFKRFMRDRLLVKKPAILLDRDGTLNQIVYNEDTEQLDSPLDPEELVLLPGVVDALSMLKSSGYLLVIVTNQPAAAKGKTSLGKLFDVNNRLREILAGEGVHLDGVLVCPHHPTGTQHSREPSLIVDCE